MKLPKNQINKSVNTRMKEIVTSKTLKEYFLSKAIKYDDYVTFRKTFSYQYAATLAINYVMSIETQLPHCLVDLKTAKISLLHFKFNYTPQELSPYSVRLSRNIKNFLTRDHINGGVLPSFIATIEALTNEKAVFRQYLNLLEDDMGYIQKNYEKVDLYGRLV